MDLEQDKIQTPFTVPSNYFDGLEGRVLALQKISELHTPSVAKGYFDDLEDSILSQVLIYKALGDEQPAKKSDAYFNSLEESILSAIKLEGLSQPKVADDYFNTLEDQVLSQVKLDVFKNLSVPEDYFDVLEKEILAKALPKPVFTLKRNFKIFRNAAAVLFISAAGLWAGTKYTNAEKDELADISREAVVAYLAEQPLMTEDLTFIIQDNDKLLTSDISDSEIENYLLSAGI